MSRYLRLTLGVISLASTGLLFTSLCLGPDNDAAVVSLEREASPPTALPKKPDARAGTEVVPPSPTELKAAWMKLLKPKPGTKYLDGLPKEITWLKDGAGMVLIPGGQFLFGQDNEKKELPPFYIDKFPVTNARYKKFVDATGHRVPFVSEDWAKPYNWRSGTYPKGKANHPVVLVDFSDVVAYCKWAGKTIPSEAQWEKAARGTDGRRYPWGDRFEDGRCNCWHERIRNTTRVDKYPKGVSPYGCYDMSGNTWEWTRTWGWTAKSKEQAWIAKGGSWFDGEVRVRAYSFGALRPQLKGNNLGFRCAAIIPE